MKKEDKKLLLLKNLAARLHYGVYVDVGGKAKKLTDIFSNCGLGFNCSGSFHGWVSFPNMRPYLRPMSSMTEGEKKEISRLLNYEFYVDEDYGLTAEDSRHRIRLDLMEVYVDWLNKKMFDYREKDGKTMIELGLALPAPEGMYQIK